MYIAKAYVRLDTLENRLHVMNSVMALGGRNYLGTVWQSRKRISISPDWLEFVPKGESLPSDFIYCNSYTPNGTEEEAVRLFLILAEMREGVDTNSFVQWNDSIYLPNLPAIPAILKGSITKIMTMIGCDGKLYHRLSPLEVAEAFKEGRIEL